RLNRFRARIRSAGRVDRRLAALEDRAAQRIEAINRATFRMRVGTFTTALSIGSVPTSFTRRSVAAGPINRRSACSAGQDQTSGPYGDSLEPPWSEQDGAA